MDFNNNSTAGSATITNGAAGDLRFDDFSTAGNATITNNNTIFFFGNSTAGNAAITNNSGAVVDFSGGPALRATTRSPPARSRAAAYSCWESTN